MLHQQNDIVKCLANLKDSHCYEATDWKMCIKHAIGCCHDNGTRYNNIL